MAALRRLNIGGRAQVRERVLEYGSIETRDETRRSPASRVRGALLWVLGTAVILYLLVIAAAGFLMA